MIVFKTFLKEKEKAYHPSSILLVQEVEIGGLLVYLYQVTVRPHRKTNWLQFGEAKRFTDIRTTKLDSPYLTYQRLIEDGLMIWYVDMVQTVDMHLMCGKMGNYRCC